jgi:hypothetical protein
MSATAATISVLDVLKLLDNQFAGLADGVARGKYVLWLGSGVSRNRVDGLPEVLRRILRFLQSQIDVAKADCRFRRALTDILSAAGISASERAAINVQLPVEEWPHINALIDRLAANYAKVLGVSVKDEALDYLLWSGADVRKTYGRSDIDPDVEHFSVAILGLEGAVSQVATANWDGLIEKAFKELGGAGSLRVVVTAGDLQTDPARVRLIKFHGCAVLAANDEATYRPLLVARQSQIDGFTTDKAHEAIVQALTTLLMTNPTLMVGLSAQDSNIRLLVAKAAGILPWKWPTNRHACVFCEDDLSADHAAALERAYGDDYAKNVDEIRQAAVLAAYGKPLLLALVLDSLTKKLCVLAEIATTARLASTDVDSMKSALINLRDVIAGLAEPDREKFLTGIVETVSNIVGAFEEGSAAVGPGLGRYRPLSTHAPQQIAAHHTAASGRAELGVGLALLALGHSNGTWNIAIDSPVTGALAVTAPTGRARLFFVANEQAAIGLAEHHKLDGQTVIVHSLKRAARMARSPVGSRGRTGVPAPRELSIGQIISEVGTLNDLVDRFRHEAVL